MASHGLSTRSSEYARMERFEDTKRYIGQYRMVESGANQTYCRLAQIG